MKTSRMNDHLSNKELNILREKVLEEVVRIEDKLRLKNLEINLNQETSGDEVDSANNEIIKHTELRFSTRETLYLKKLNKTKMMLDSVEYGMCEDCGGEITFTRLLARPTSTMCITCKEESERDELQSFHGRQSKSLGTTHIAPLR